MHRSLARQSESGRRQFLSRCAGLSAAGLAAISAMDSQDAAAADDTATTGKSILQSGQVILFQGDSITDVRRDRRDIRPNSQKALGSGYPWLAASQLLIDSPQDGYKFYNRGISGNKVYQLAERWQADCLELKPDVVTILIGVNDYWHLKEGSFGGDVDKYEGDFNELLHRTKVSLPNVRLVVCEPFLLPCGHVTAEWVTEFKPYQAAARRVARGAGATFLAFQEIFDIAVKFAEPNVWAEDGVHPSHSGAAIMAHYWHKTLTGGAKALS